MRVAVLDLGSTSFHLLVADGQPDGRIESGARERVGVGLGRSLAAGHSIGARAARRAVERCERLYHLAVRSAPDRILTVATAAFREAANGRAVVAEMERAIGDDIWLLSGDEEARLAFMGIVADVGVPASPTVAADLGGGSLDIARGGPGGADAAASLRLGVEVLGATHADGPTIRAAARFRLRAVIGECLAGAADLLDDAPEIMVGGGWSRAVGKAAAGLFSLADDGEPLELSTHELDELFATLAGLTPDGRSALPGVKARRAGYLPVAVAVLSELAGRSPTESVVVSGWGLREGIVLEALGRPRLPERGDLDRRDPWSRGLQFAAEVPTAHR